MQTRWFRTFIMAGVFAAVVGGVAPSVRMSFTTPAFAQQAAAAGDAVKGGWDKNKKPETFMDYWRQGGTTMWPLLAIAVWATAILIELLMKLRMRHICPTDVVQQIIQALQVQDYQKAWKIGADNPNVFTRIFCAALEKLPSGREAFDTAAIEAATTESNAFRSKNAYINLNATVAPLLGLFGTMSGMIGAFNSMAYSGAVGDPTKLAGDIGEALITTYAGLVIAIPALCAYYILGNRIKKLMEAVQGRLNTVFDQIDFDGLPSDLVIATKEMRAAAAMGTKGARPAPAPAAVKAPTAGAVKAVPSAAKAEIVSCPNCKKDVTVGAKVCPHCNAELAWE